MSTQPPRRLRSAQRPVWTAQWLALLAFMSILLALACIYQWSWRLDFAVYDASLPTRPAPSDVVIVAIDDASIDSIGRWPWRRAIHATLLERLRAMGARVVAFDILMTEADPDDALLASAMRQGLPTVLPLMVRFPRNGGSIREELPVEPLAKSAATIGHVNVDVDPDGMVRSLFLQEGLGSPERPYLATAVLEQLSGGVIHERCGANHPDLQHAPHDVWVRDCRILIPYSGPPGHFARVSYADVLAGRVSDSAIRGKIVLVGATAQGVGDAWSTPVSGGALAMPGVEIMANVLQAERDGTLVRNVSLVPTIILTLLPIYLLGVALRVLRPRWSMMSGIAIWLATLGGSILALQLTHWWWPPSAALLAILVLCPLWIWRRLMATQLFMRHLADTINGLPDATLASDTHGQIMLANPAAIQLFGSDLVGTPVAHHLQRAIGPGTVEINLFEPVQHYLLRTAPFIDSEQRNVGMILTLTDITELRKAQRERDDVIRFLSHDMKSPASSLLGLARLQRDPQRALPGPELSDRLDVLAQRTLTLVDGFVALARAESSDPNKFDELDVRDAIQDAYDEVWAAANAREISIAVSAPTALVLVDADRQLLARAIINLLGNAVKFSPDRSIVQLECLIRSAAVVIRITDSGPGIDVDQQVLLFERFTRGLHRGAKDPGGAGLGLAFVRVVAEKHGGKVWVESPATTGAASAAAVGSIAPTVAIVTGAVFCLSLPAKRS